jgi:hypothetical protein
MKGNIMTDTTVKTQTETQALFRDLDKPSLHALSYVLRHPDTWPDGFVWDYRYCDQCAMGLAHELWKDKVADTDIYNGASIMARRFGMAFEEARAIFMEARGAPRRYFIGPRNYDAHTPERVADQIDAYLKKCE